jgi:hypothetical protein
MRDFRIEPVFCFLVNDGVAKASDQAQKLNMRPKFAATILLVAALLIGAVVFLKFRPVAPPPKPAPVVVAVNQPPQPRPAPAPVVEPPVVAPAPAPPAPVVAPPPPAPTNTLTAEEREAAIEAEVAKLQDWQGNTDSVSYSNILNDLTHPERQVRFAAIESLKQVDNTNAIPVLKDLAAKTDDVEEAKALLDAAHFISLPQADLSGLFKHVAPDNSGTAPNPNP